MNKHVKIFLQRGIAFGGFGPVVTAIVYAIIGAVTKDNLITTSNFLIATISTYILAFIVAGCSILYNIESWSTLKALLIHLAALYASYLLVYALNSWVEFNWISVLIFTAVFVVGYLFIWLIIYICLKLQAKKMNLKVKDVINNKKEQL